METKEAIEYLNSMILMWNYMPATKEEWTLRELTQNAINTIIKKNEELEKENGTLKLKLLNLNNEVK